MKRDLWDAEHKCTRCNSSMKRKRLVVEGMTVRGWECVKCKESVLHPEDAERMLVASKLRRGLAVTVGELGTSLVVRIPKDVAKLCKLHKGEQVIVKVDTDRRIGLELPA